MGFIRTEPPIGDGSGGGGVPTSAYMPDMVGLWTDTGVTPGFHRQPVMLIGTTLYAFGPDIYSAPIADPTNWTDTTANIALGVPGMRVGIIGDTIYAFGAIDNSVHILTAAVADPLTWSDSGHDLPARRDNAPLVLGEDRVLIFGGYDGGGGHGSIMWALYADLTSWTITGWKGAFWEAGAARAGEPTYVFGGVNDVGLIYPFPVSRPLVPALSTYGTFTPFVEHSPDIFHIGEYLYIMCSGNTHTALGRFPLDGENKWFNCLGGDATYLGGCSWLDNDGYAYFVDNVAHHIWRSPRVEVWLQNAVVPGTSLGIPATFLDGTPTMYTTQCITKNRYWHYRPDLTAVI